MKSRNFFASVVNTTSTLIINTEFSVTHGLMTTEDQPVIPVGYIVCRRSGAGTLYPGTTAWTTTTAYFKCDTASIAFLVLFFA